MILYESLRPYNVSIYVQFSYDNNLNKKDI